MKIVARNASDDIIAKSGFGDGHVSLGRKCSNN